MRQHNPLIATRADDSPMPRKRRPKPITYTATLHHMAAEYAYVIVQSQRRSISVEIDRDRQIKVRAPLQIERDTIQQWVQTKAHWIASKYLDMEQHHPQRAPLSYADGEEHWYLGQAIQLRLLPGQRGTARLANQQLHLPCASTDPAHTQRRLIEWYRHQAHEVFHARLASCWPAFSARGHQCPSLRIRQMKTLWGSLSGRQKMTLNLKLIKAPEHLIDYVVVHELCHLEHHNHGPGFKRLMDQMQPDWRERKAQLNTQWA